MGSFFVVFCFVFFCLYGLVGLDSAARKWRREYIEGSREG